MLMVILGAGASYDSVPFLPPGSAPQEEQRPPLAKDLFAPRGDFLVAMSTFSECRSVIPQLQNPMSGSVEQELERLQSEADEYPVRLQQLAAIRYYLQYVLWTCGDNWESKAH